MYISMAFNPYNTTKEERKQEIIKYLISHPNKEEKEVLQFCRDEGIGSKMTVTEAIKELLAEGTLDSGKKRKNSKSYKLSVVTANPLLTVPKDLDEIYIEFQKFVRSVSSLLEEIRDKNKEKRLKLPGATNFEYLRNIKTMPFLPYQLIEIINHVYNFYIIFVLPLEIKNPEVIKKLSAIYFESLLKMYSFAAREMHWLDDIQNIVDIKKSPIYQSYIELEKSRQILKVSLVAEKCKLFDIQDNLYKVLDLLWIKNIKFIGLVYELDFFSSIYKRLLKRLNKTLLDYDYQYHDLKILHICIDDFTRPNKWEDEFDYLNTS